MISLDRTVGRNTPIFMESVNHLNRESSFVFQHLSGARGRTGEFCQIVLFSAQQFHMGFQKLGGLRRVDGEVLIFVSLHQDREDVKAIGFRSTRFRLSETLLFDLADGRCEVVIISDGSDIFRYTDSGSMA